MILLKMYIWYMFVIMKLMILIVLCVCVYILDFVFGGIYISVICMVIGIL